MLGVDHRITEHVGVPQDERSSASHSNSIPQISRLPSSPGSPKPLVLQTSTNRPSSNVPSPLYYLPVELISEIFTIVVSSRDEDRPSDAARLLSTVNSRLRYIAIHTPALWSPMIVNITFDLICEELPARHLQLERCGNYPLEVMIYSVPCLFDCGGPEQVAITQSLRFLSDIVRRAYTLHISSLNVDLLPTLNVPSPSLRHLKLDRSPTIPLPFFPGTATWLRHVEVTCSTHSEAAKFLCECPHLQSLVLVILDTESSPSIAHASASLEAIYQTHALTLESLHLTLWGNVAYTFTKPRGGVIFQNLRSLKLTAIGVISLDAIMAPSLESFAMTCNTAYYRQYNFEEDDGTGELLGYVANYRFLERHMNSLRDVSMSVPGYYHDYPKELADQGPIHFAHLRSLDIASDWPYAERLYEMTSSTLESLSINVGGVHGVPWNRMISFIHDNSTHLSSLSIICDALFMPIGTSVFQDAAILSFPNLETFHSSGADLVLLRVASAPKLAKINISFLWVELGYRLDDPTISPQINLPALTTLEAQYCSPALPLIRAPKLETLTVPGWEMGGVLVHFLKHHPTILTLNMISPKCRPPLERAVADKLVFLPSMRTLIIQDSEYIPSCIVGFNLDRLRICDLIMPNPMPKVFNVTRLELGFAMLSNDWQSAFRDLHGVKALSLILSRGCDHTSLLLAMTSPHSCLFPDLVEIELCFINFFSMSALDRRAAPEPDCDFRLLQALIIARKECEVGKPVEILTLRQRGRVVDWGSVDYPDPLWPRYESLSSPLSPDMRDWFTRNVSTFNLESSYRRESRGEIHPWVYRWENTNQ